MSEIPTLSLAVMSRLIPGWSFTGPIELIGAAGVNSGWPLFGSLPGTPKPKALFNIEYVAETLDPIRPLSGPPTLPTKTFDEVASKQFDVILVPGGPGAHPDIVPKPTLEWVKGQASQAQYILSVCTGSWLLAGAGVLEGKRATTNKFTFKEIKEKTSSAIQWIPKARWVVDGNLWTSSGVTAGQDMAYEFLKTVSGEEFATTAKNLLELRATHAGDDEFADVFGLV